jgi:hypothetical protein
MNGATPPSSSLRAAPEPGFDRSAMRDAPAIRPFAELNPELVHWSELDRTNRAFGAAGTPELLTRDVRTFFGRFG